MDSNNSWCFNWQILLIDIVIPFVYLLPLSMLHSKTFATSQSSIAYFTLRFWNLKIDSWWNSCIKYSITRLNSKNLCIIFIPNLIRKRFLLVFHNNWNLFPEWKWISTTKKQVGVSSFILSLQHGLKSRCNSVTTFNNFLSTSYTSLNSHLLA